MRRGRGPGIELDQQNGTARKVEKENSLGSHLTIEKQFDAARDAVHRGGARAVGIGRCWAS